MCKFFLFLALKILAKKETNSCLLKFSKEICKVLLLDSDLKWIIDKEWLFSDKINLLNFCRLKTLPFWSRWVKVFGSKIKMF